ncbi:hypothetical protein Angca_000833, partial [Angiostrongylus cantonensis]
ENFIRSKNTKLSIIPEGRSIHPKVLLVCSDLFPLLDSNPGQGKTLPGGFKVIPSKKG